MGLDLKNVDKKVKKTFGNVTVSVVETVRPAVVMGCGPGSGTFAVQDGQVWGMGGEPVENPPEEFWVQYEALTDDVKTKLGLVKPKKGAAKEGA